MPVTRLWKDFLHLFFPETCCVCSSIPDETLRFLCAGCRMKLPYTRFEQDACQYMSNPAAQMLAGRLPLSFVISFLFFQKKGSVQKILHAIKYRGLADLAFELGYLFGERISKTPLAASLDVLLPVPLHPARLRQRGYNQSELLARGIALGVGGRAIVVHDAIVRSSYTESQTRKSLLSRWHNVASAFTLRQPALLAGRSLVLVDDVLTTGATIEALGCTAMQAKPRQMGVMTLAFAGEPF